MPTEFIVADFFVYASVQFAGHYLKETVAYMNGKKRGDKIRSGFIAGGRIRGSPFVGKMAT